MESCIIQSCCDILIDLTREWRAILSRSLLLSGCDELEAAEFSFDLSCGAPNVDLDLERIRVRILDH